MTAISMHWSKCETIQLKGGERGSNSFTCTTRLVIQAQGSFFDFQKQVKESHVAELQ